MAQNIKQSKDIGSRTHSVLCACVGVGVARGLAARLQLWSGVAGGPRHYLQRALQDDFGILHNAIDNVDANPHRIHPKHLVLHFVVQASRYHSPRQQVFAMNFLLPTIAGAGRASCC
jgi:hypothetical protein